MKDERLRNNWKLGNDCHRMTTTHALSCTGKRRMAALVCGGGHGIGIHGTSIKVAARGQWSFFGVV